MALHFTLMVNDIKIGKFVAVRREKKIPVDRICTYDVEVTMNGVTNIGVVRHNYDHGAAALIRAGLDDL